MDSLFLRDSLAQDIEWFKEALAMPVLTLANIPAATSNGRSEMRNRSDNLSREQLMAELDLE